MLLFGFYERKLREETCTNLRSNSMMLVKFSIPTGVRAHVGTTAGDVMWGLCQAVGRIQMMMLWVMVVINYGNTWKKKNLVELKTIWTIEVRWGSFLGNTINKNHS